MQIAALKKNVDMYGDEIQDNYRPTQALNNRTVYHHVAGPAGSGSADADTIVAPAPCDDKGASNCTTDSDCCLGLGCDVRMGECLCDIGALNCCVENFDCKNNGPNMCGYRSGDIADRKCCSQSTCTPGEDECCNDESLSLFCNATTSRCEAAP